MPIRAFQLERFFAQWEFSAPYLLSASDCESLSIGELLEVAGVPPSAVTDLRLGYTESQGDPALRASIARFHTQIASDNIVITNAPEEAIFLVMMTVLDPGDRVVVQTPCYQSLFELAAYRGCDVHSWSMVERGDRWHMDLDHLTDLVTPDTRLLVVNIPHNPTGYLPTPDEYQAVLDIADQKLDGGRLALAMNSGLVLLDPATGDHSSYPSAQAGLSVASDGTRVWLGSSQGLWELTNETLFQEPALGDVPVRDVCIAGSVLWLATSSGVLAFDGATVSEYTLANSKLPDDDVRALTTLDSGGVLVGCATGAAVVGAAADRIIEPGVDSLAYGDLLAVAASAERWAFAHGIGASFVDASLSQRDYYHSLRWIPGQQVRAVALQGLNRRWIATEGGISRIDLVPTTLADKAALMESCNEGFWRLDFVSDDGRRDDPWDLDEAIFHHDHDNDGLWTQMQIGAWCFAAAATGDQSYCERARRAMGAMLWQIDIPAVDFEAAGMQPGFVTRSFVRDDEGIVFDTKATQENWHLVENWQDGHDYYWKDDTSSDETTGHFFGYPLFFDFCATDEERQDLADHAGALARYIVDNGFVLIDLDGEETTHGHWNPERMSIAVDGLSACMDEYELDACAEARYGGGWLNSIEILGHLLAAYHMTGDPFFYEAYESLLDEHRYAEVVDFNDDIFTVSKRSIANHSDHELAMLAYHTLIRYEPDETRRQRWIQSLLGMYAWEIPERNPLWAAILAGFVPDGYQLNQAVGTLREWPEDWREWLVDNSHRLDVRRDAIPDRFGDPQFTTVLPYDEIRTMKWNGNPYSIVGGGDGRSVQAPWPWLLPYWMFRYHAAISPSQ